jgi:hypothetical protein
MPTTSFLQKFDQLSKLSLGGELGGASIIGKICRVDYFYPEKKPLFDHFSSMSECLPSYILAALRVLLELSKTNVGEYGSFPTQPE